MQNRPCNTYYKHVLQWQIFKAIKFNSKLSKPLFSITLVIYSVQKKYCDYGKKKQFSKIRMFQLKFYYVDKKEFQK